jgi:hypothetical protein
MASYLERGPCGSCHRPAIAGTPSKIRRNKIPVSAFRMNTYKSVSKQTTLTAFRMNTYEKQGGGGYLAIQFKEKEGANSLPLP